MAAQDDIETIRTGYEAFARGDTEGVVAPWAAEMAFHYPGRSAVAGDYRGKEDVLGLLREIAARSGGTFHLAIHDILATDEHVVVLCREQAERDGMRLDTPASHVWHTRDGKLTEFWDLIADLYALDEFWGG